MYLILIVRLRLLPLGIYTYGGSYSSGSKGFYRSATYQPVLTLEGRKKSGAGYYNGSAWEPCLVKYYDGSVWQNCDVKYYDGTGWIPVGAP